MGTYQLPAFLDNGFQLFYVGGFVRSLFTGEEHKDVDIATGATPKQMIDLCNSYNIPFRTTKNGVAHGTVVINEMEFTTFRKDVSCDGRNAIVEFAKTIEEDLSRRDFTMNAMAINLQNGEFLDPFGGKKDIKDKTIRAVGDPKERLQEDTLRALRAIRFANQLGFTIEENLLNEIEKCDISNLSRERVRDELLKLLSTRNHRYFELSISEKIFPELKELYIDGGNKHFESVFFHSFECFYQMMKLTNNPILVLTAMLHDIGKGRTAKNPERMFKGHEDVGAEMTKQIMERLKFPTKDVGYAYKMVKEHMRWHFMDGKPSNKALRKAINAVGEENIEDMLKLTWCDEKANLANKNIKDFELISHPIWIQYQKMKETDTAMKVTDLAVNGNDLIKMGIQPGPIFSEILEDCLDRVSDNLIANDKSTLLFYISVRELHKMPENDKTEEAIKQDEKV